MSVQSPSPTDDKAAVQAHLKTIYHTYRHTPSIPDKGEFFSRGCMQVCRPNPPYAAVNRETIVQYLLEASGYTDLEDWETKNQGGDAAASTKVEDGADVFKSSGAVKGYYTIRPLSLEEENEVLALEVVEPLGLSPVELGELHMREGWVGMRVDLWDDDGHGKGRLIKVKYWWRYEEGTGWVQCLHDIMSIGERDGSEGSGGEVRE